MSDQYFNVWYYFLTVLHCFESLVEGKNIPLKQFFKCKGNNSIHSPRISLSFSFILLNYGGGDASILQYVFHGLSIIVYFLCTLYVGMKKVGNDLLTPTWFSVMFRQSTSTAFGWMIDLNQSKTSKFQDDWETS